MSVISIQRNFNDTPQIVNMTVSVSQATVAATGWLALPATILQIETVNNGVWVWQPGDMVLVYSQADNNDVLYQVNSTTNSLVLYSTAGSGGVTLPVTNNDFVNFSGVLGQLYDAGYSPSDPAKTKVVMAGSAVQANYIAHFVDTAGTIDDTAATVQNDGSIQAGKSGTAGTLISFPGTAGNGSLIIAALNAGGAFNTTIRNSVMGQSSVISIPDPGLATSKFLLTDSATTQTIATGNLVLTLGALTVSAGAITASASNITAGSAGNPGHFVSFPATAANGTLLLTAANAGGPNNTTISNGSMAQSTTYVIPDAGNANAKFLVGATATPFVSGEFPVASGTGGLMVSSGLAATNIQNKSNIIAAQSADIGGAGAGPLNIVNASVAATSVIVASIISSSNPCSIIAVAPGAGSFNVTVSADPGASLLISYVIFVAPQ